DGKMSKGDFSKLAGIEANATADQTKEEIIAAIESAEGEGRLSANALKDHSVLSPDDFTLNETTGQIEMKTSVLDPAHFTKTGETIRIREELLGNGEGTPGTGGDVPMASETVDGKMSKEDFAKLKGI